MTNFKRLSKILEAIFMPLGFLTALYFIIAAIIGLYLPDAARALAVSVGLWYLSTLIREPCSLSHGSRFIKRFAIGTGDFLYVNTYDKPCRALGVFFAVAYNPRYLGYGSTARFWLRHYFFFASRIQ